MSQKPWTDEDTLYRLYHSTEKDMSTAEIAAELGCTRRTVHRWLNKYDIIKHPWWSKYQLYALHIQEGLSKREIADEWGCSVRTIRKWCRRHNIDTDDRCNAQTENPISYTD